MAASSTLPDYYTVLQVQPDADIEVISAAYRQLMKKYHPDVAGSNPAQIAEHHRRSKEINQAFGVLRDPRRRRHYDETRLMRGWRPPPETTRTGETQPATSGSSRTGVARGDYGAVAGQEAPARASAPPPIDYEPSVLVREEPPPAHLAPFRLIAQAYYLLPGRYEWEPERRTELATILMLPLIGTIGFCLATGRLAPLIGSSLTAMLIAWAVLALSALLMWQSLPRIAVAVVPLGAVLTGVLDPILAQAHMPVWMAAGFLGCLSTFLAGRQFVFGVLPTVGICWMLTRLI